MAGKRSTVAAKPMVRFVQKRPCGSNGKPIKKSRGRGRPYMGGQRAKEERRKKLNPDRSHGVWTENKNTVRAASRSAFRFQGKTYGLTYSSAKSIISKEQVQSFLIDKLGQHFCCVSLEYHAEVDADGNRIQHFHVAGRCDAKLDIDDCRFFDIVSPTEVVEHPNIVKGGPAWLQYVMKGGDFISNFPGKPNHYADALACGSADAALTHVMNNDAPSYVRFGANIESNLQRHYRRACRQQVPRWSGPYPAGRFPPNWDPTTHALHLFGPPGSGKTVFAQFLLRCLYGDCDYIKGHVESMKSLSFTKPFVFDEVMLLLEPQATSREITDVVSGGTIHARYNCITIPPGIARIFISNQRWVFKNPDDSVYGRRLIQHEHPFSCPIEEWRLHNPPMDIRPPPRPPTPEQPPPPPPGSPPPGVPSPPPPPDDDATDMITEMDDAWPGIFDRWEAAVDDFALRPRPSRAPAQLAIGAAPLPATPEGIRLPASPPLALQLFGIPAPATPPWSPGWSPLLPYDDVFDMDIDPFEETLCFVRREDL